ncbi:DUF1479-domain-containing protein [Amniculicola lignicola CBS 123094]|uniref:DUF1479-domain-containing protein n=1 Tax=Amniculicola lignicola CBS 123094 TaxID=1392246 RepID=A0A6A5WE47_9PLEO|nr:DUF1479-domain-containing protein [Amniculicola lignicola CBS 123094]
MPYTTQIQVLLEPPVEVPVLEQRFADLKQKLVKPEHKQKVIESYGTLCNVLKEQADFIEKNGPRMVPEIDFNEVKKNGGLLPDDFSALVRERGCVILRNVVSEEQAVQWEQDLLSYTKRHSEVGGFPVERPTIWSLFWTPTQVQIRSHPRVMEVMRCVSKLWTVSNPTVPVDLDSQVVYPDRFRIRYPNKEAAYVLPAHLDSGAIERWEDPVNRSNYSEIFEGNWENWDGWVADKRIDAQSDLYHIGNSCSCWRSLQGWLSLSHSNTGEGTLRILPSLKASVAYCMLRPLFGSNGEFDDTQPTFPGSEPGKTQFKPTNDFHPHLAMEKSVVGIPPVRPGDYVFWHCDLVHEVDKYHPGTRNSTAVYNACNPLTPYNIDSLLSVREAFEKAAPPRDFTSAKLVKEIETDHVDHGARRENIWSEDGLKAIGLKKLDVDEEGLTEGQREVRRLANVKLGFA